MTGNAETDPIKIKEIMGKQINHPVRWVELIGNMMTQRVSCFVEVGPKKVLLGLVRKCLPKDYEYRSYNVEDLKSLDALASAEKAEDPLPSEDLFL